MVHLIQAASLAHRTPAPSIAISRRRSLPRLHQQSDASSHSSDSTHGSVVSMLRLLAIAYVGKNAVAVKQRAETLDAIVEELDLLE